jgi:hypothetical protein
MFALTSTKLTFSVEKLKSQKEKQIANFSTDFWNAEKQTFKKMN